MGEEVHSVGEPHSTAERERETEFLQTMGAFMRRDFGAIAQTWSPDVMITLPGASWLAGIYRGFDEVSRCVLGLRRVLASEEQRITFLHQGDQMIVQHDIVVSGPLHSVWMTLRVRVRYDGDGRSEAIFLEPEDQALFDHVLNSVLRNQSTA